MNNHINFQYDYLTNEKVVNINMKIGPDEYTSKINLSFYDVTRLNQIIKIFERINHLFKNHKYIVKNFIFYFEESSFTIKYNFTNFNNNLHLNLLNENNWLYGFDLVSKIPKNSSTVEIDNLSSMFFNSNI